MEEEKGGGGELTRGKRVKVNITCILDTRWNQMTETLGIYRFEYKKVIHSGSVQAVAVAVAFTSSSSR